MISLSIEPLVFLLLVSPILLIGKKQETSDWTLLMVFSLYFIADSVFTTLPLTYSRFDFLDLTMNWEGKILSYLGVGLFLIIYRKIPLSQYGFTLQQAPNSTSFSLRTLVIVTILISIYGFLIGGYSASFENILFQLTMPSIVEELVYRGILLTLLNLYFVHQFRLGQTRFGVGLIITSILFGLWHGLIISSTFAFSMNWFAFILTGLIGFLLGLVKERSGSLVYPIILHILINLIPNLIGLILN